MAKKYDLAVKVGSYQKDGETKNRYQNVGAVIDGERGPYILLERWFNPAGVPNPEDRSNVIISMFEPRDRNSGGGGGGGFNDNVPF